MTDDTAVDVQAQEIAQRNAMARFIHDAGWSFVLKDTATRRWGQTVTVRIAERGTFPHIQAQGWTNTHTGTIFIREEIFNGIDVTDDLVRKTVNAVARRVFAGSPVNLSGLLMELDYHGYSRVTDDQRRLVWKIAQTIAANYGVLGHEYCHAAYSEHARRNDWHMGLEDLRAESLWMAQDPIRARQGLRACAASWVTHNASPMRGEQTFDFSRIRTHAALLHVYLLVGGRGRIGVLDDRSTLVTGVVDLTTNVLGWETVSDANDIIDRFLETAEDPTDADGIAQREALSEEFAALLPEAAGMPNDGIGCQCDPEEQIETPEQPQPGEGGGQGGSESGESEDDGDGGEGEGQGANDADEVPEQGDQSGSGQGDDTGTGDDQGEGDRPGQGDESDGDQSDGTDGQGGRNSGEGDIDGETGSGHGSGQDDDASDDGERDLTVADTGKRGSDDGDAGDTGTSGGQDVHADFLTGEFGERIRPGAEDVTDEIDDSDAFRLTQDQVDALAEILSDGLEEVSDSESEVGWALSNEAGALVLSKFISPAQVSADVFSRQALATRNRRIKI